MSSTSMTHCTVAHTGQGHDTLCTMIVAEPSPIWTPLPVSYFMCGAMTALPGVVHAVARGGATAGLIILKYLFVTIFVCGPYVGRHCTMKEVKPSPPWTPLPVSYFMCGAMTALPEVVPAGAKGERTSDVLNLFFTRCKIIYYKVTRYGEIYADCRSVREGRKEQ